MSGSVLRRIVALLMVCVSAGPLWAKPPLEIVTATYFGPSDDNDLQGAAAGPQGTIYIVGNTAGAAENLPGGVSPATFGSQAKQARCGCGFVAQLSPDGKTILHYAQFAPGVVLLTTVQAGEQGVYISGYGSESLQDLLKDRPGLIRQFPLTEEIRRYEEEKAAGKEDKIAGRPGLGRYGAPCILRLSADLQKVECGTYLEGWQQVWDKKRVAKPHRTPEVGRGARLPRRRLFPHAHGQGP